MIYLWLRQSLYEILEAIKIIPESAGYRKTVEATVKHRCLPKSVFALSSELQNFDSGQVSADCYDLEGFFVPLVLHPMQR